MEMLFIVVFIEIIVTIFIVVASLKIDSAINKITNNLNELKKEVESYNKTKITKDDISSIKKDLDYIVPRVSEICYKIKNQPTININSDSLKPGRVYSEDNLTPSNIC